MNYDEAVARLVHHANLPQAASIPPDDSIVYLFRAAAREWMLPNLDGAREDILNCLAVVNRALNENTPSQVSQGKAPGIDRLLAYSMAIILNEGWRLYQRTEERGLFSTAASDTLGLLLRVIGAAWEAVLAGDIDDLRGHLVEEGITEEQGL